MGIKAGRKEIVAAAGLCICVVLSVILILSGCGGGTAQDENVTQVTDTATAFLDACGNQNTEEVRSFLSQDYLESNQVPDPLTRQDLIAALGTLVSYRLLPEEGIEVQGDQAVVIVSMDIEGRGEKEETIILSRQDGEWKIDGLTAMDWTIKPEVPGEEQVEVEEALRDFIIACIDQQTEYIFSHLSEDYRSRYRLEKPWTSAEFSGIFGTARSYNFDPKQIAIEDHTAEVDVTIEFGSRGNLQSETALVRLVKERNDWLIDAFPFFIY